MTNAPFGKQGQVPIGFGTAAVNRVLLDRGWDFDVCLSSGAVGIAIGIAETDMSMARQSVMGTALPVPTPFF